MIMRGNNIIYYDTRDGAFFFFFLLSLDIKAPVGQNTYLTMHDLKDP